MKKLKLLIIFNVLLSVLFNNTNIIFANEDDEIEPTAIIYCDLYKGKHKVVNRGTMQRLQYKKRISFNVYLGIL